MNSQKEILDFLNKNRQYLSDTYHLTKLGLFGSFARDEQTQFSDVDLLIEIEDGTKNIHDLKVSLNSYFTKAFSRSIDIARVKYLKPYAKESILKDTIFV